MNKPKSVEEWRRIIDKARSSGLSDKDWCLAHGVSINTFYYNVRRLRRNACAVPEAVGKYSSSPQAVVPVEIVDDTSMSTPEKDLTAAISINCNGLCISISNTASPTIIKAVLCATKEALC